MPLRASPCVIDLARRLSAETRCAVKLTCKQTRSSSVSEKQRETASLIAVCKAMHPELGPASPGGAASWPASGACASPRGSCGRLASGGGVGRTPASTGGRGSGGRSPASLGGTGCGGRGIVSLGGAGVCPGLETLCPASLEGGAPGSGMDIAITPPSGSGASVASGAKEGPCDCRQALVLDTSADQRISLRRWPRPRRRLCGSRAAIGSMGKLRQRAGPLARRSMCTLRFRRPSCTCPPTTRRVYKERLRTARRFAFSLSARV